jgi:hypothetical protein
MTFVAASCNTSDSALREGKLCECGEANGRGQRGGT